MEVRFYFDYRSPFAYLAKDLVYGIEDHYPPDAVHVRWLPFAFPVEEGFGLPGSRSRYHLNKVKYAYVDARQWANERDPPLVIKGPQRVFDSTRANAAGLFAQSLGRPVFRAYTDRVYREFFERRLDIEQAEAIRCVLQDAVARHAGDHSQAAAGWESRYAAFVGDDEQQQEEGGGGAARGQLAEIREAAEEEGVFGVPSFVVGGHLFFGADRFHWVRRRLDALLAARHTPGTTQPTTSSST